MFPDQEVSTYDANGNVWTVVVDLPRRFYNFECASQYGDRIFVNGFARPDNSQISYMFQPSTGRSVVVDVPEAFTGKVVSTITVEI